MAHKTEALAKGGRVYTIINHHTERHDPLRWAKYIGFRDGVRWRAFRSKKEFREAVDMEPDFFPSTPVTEQYVNAMHAQFLSEYAGEQTLRELQLALAKQKREGGQEFS